MLLAVDIGNTNIVLGIFQQEKLIKKWRIATDISKTEDEYAILLQNLLQGLAIRQVVLSSVVPRLNDTFCKLVDKYYHLQPFIVSSSISLGIKIKYQNPEEIGADRLVNAAAAAELYSLPAIIIDFGTATTFCYIDKNRNYLGGLILPGLPLMMKALHQGTAQLPEVQIKDVNWIIGRNTMESIQSGVFHQTIGAIDHIINLLYKKYNAKAKVIITGGIGRLFYKKIKYKAVLDPDLTLKGLNIINKLNKK